MISILFPFCFYFCFDLSVENTTEEEKIPKELLHKNHHYYICEVCLELTLQVLRGRIEEEVKGGSLASIRIALTITGTVNFHRTIHVP